MTEEKNRRFEDSLLGKIVYSWPLLVGLCTLLTGLGAFIATAKNMDERLTTVEIWITNERQSALERNRIMERLTTLEEVSERRIGSLEDWRNGTDVWNSGGRKRTAHDAEH